MGTTFTPGQLSQLQSNINIAVATALPDVASKFEPKSVLKALDGRGEVFAGHLVAALEQAINRMLVLETSGLATIMLAKQHDPDAFYRTRSGLYVWDDFRTRVIAKARPSDAGTIFKIEHILLTRDMNDAEIEVSLPKSHLFDETQVCALIAGMIAEQSDGEEGKLLNNGYANLFYMASCVVRVGWGAGRRGWDVRACGRDDGWWGAGRRVFSPATVV